MSHSVSLSPARSGALPCRAARHAAGRPLVRRDRAQLGTGGRLAGHKRAKKIGVARETVELGESTEAEPFQIGPRCL